MTKCGRYGPQSFDYSPKTIRESVKRSLERLNTDYLDTVYLHDVEFVCTPVAPQSTGDHSIALSAQASEYGLVEGEEGKVHGDGDRVILAAFAELQKLKAEGAVRRIGITGYPLPTLLRLALLILHCPPYEPVDVILSYSHLSLQNATFTTFAPHFRDRARVGQLLAASPLSMGLLTPTPPGWHPSPPKLLNTVSELRDAWAGDLPDLALGFSIRHAGQVNGGVPLVVGFSNTREVHHCMKVWREVEEGADDAERLQGEKLAQGLFKDAGYLDWSWASP
ncbi:hypothetical protein HGRIS_009851 [Hohenbuehelia grisea]|uniref:NADP-dependent oxidoreductase domain-containing protein n=1 Tax=Hohenbuehelia grisea TaxID=104357 RepID=A0ABR3J2E2_9AGAR